MERFSDIGSKERKITDFMVALKEAERSTEKENTKHKHLSGRKLVSMKN